MTSITHNGYIVTLNEALTDEEDTALRDFLDHLRAKQQQKEALRRFGQPNYGHTESQRREDGDSGAALATGVMVGAALGGLDTSSPPGSSPPDSSSDSFSGGGGDFGGGGASGGY